MKRASRQKRQVWQTQVVEPHGQARGTFQPVRPWGGILSKSPGQGRRASRRVVLQVPNCGNTYAASHYRYDKVFGRPTASLSMTNG